MRLARSALLVTVFLLPWSGLTPLPTLHPHAALVDVALVVALIAWAATLVRRPARPRLRPLHAALALYAGWCAVSLFAHGASASAAAKVAGVALWVLAAPLTSALVREKAGSLGLARIVEYSLALVAGAAGLGVVLAAFGVATPLVGGHGDLLPGSYARAQAGLSHPNLLGSYCLFAMAFVGGARGGGWRDRHRWLAGLAALVALLALSRSLLSLAVAAAIAAARSRAQKRLAAALAVVVAGANLTLTLVHVELDPTRPTELRVAGYDGPRLLAARSALSTLAHHPLVGSGPATPPALVHGMPFDAHLTPLNVAAGLGLPAALAIVAIALALFRGRGRPADRALWGALTAIALDGLTQDVEDFRHIWILVGVADAGRRGGNDGP